MILWTIQRPDAVESLNCKGALIADGGEPEPHFESAYRWMASQMGRRVGCPVDGRRPLWAWRVWHARHARPDLRSSGHLERGSRGARIEFSIDPRLVLLSDFSLWHFVLNYWYLPSSRRDGKAFESAVTSAGLNYYTMKPLADLHLHARIEASWERIFALDRSIPGITDPPNRRSIQATLWSLPITAVRRVTWFRAR